MPKKTHFLLFLSAVLIILLAAVHIVASIFYLYWTIPWLDIPMHFLGGVWAAATALWVYFFSDYFGGRVFDKRVAWTIALGSAVIIGIGWEIFEYVLSATFASNYWLDTSIDLLLDVLGATLLYSVVCRQEFFRR